MTCLALRVLPALPLFLLAACGDGSSAPGPTPGPTGDPYVPAWSVRQPAQTTVITHDTAMSDSWNGAALKQAIQSLLPGQRLEIGGGTWSVDSYFAIDLQGTADEPVWIVARAGDTPIVTRADVSQNTINIGVNTASRYLCIRGLEITGGDTAVKLYSCENLWIDRCHVHDCAGPGIAANSGHSRFLHLTHNEVHHTGGTGEGMYLGAGNSVWVMSHSVIAENHVHDCFGTQGDGIEVKQGSFGNWIVGNRVHDCNYPCILVYGTGGNPVNVIERNVCFNSNDNVMQVQGEAIVRNNLLIAGAVGFSSNDHEGLSHNLTVVHNTIVNTGRGANLSSWNGRANMVFANNVAYSRTAEAVRFPNGSTGVSLGGNIVIGPVVGASSGFTTGQGLADFVDLTWDATRRDGRPSTGGSLPGSGDPAWAVVEDLTGAIRTTLLESGCYDQP